GCLLSYAAAFLSDRFDTPYAKGRLVGLGRACRVVPLDGVAGACCTVPRLNGPSLTDAAIGSSFSF
ncbi:hypothetical protein, partial [Roseinatronobacter sp. NSM]|uniref:hypothetical protein n=1 Tax=Roseinatronobacter sp. NSM TaxID=3457785 RepID=UPI0040355DA4